MGMRIGGTLLLHATLLGKIGIKTEIKERLGNITINSKLIHTNYFTFPLIKLHTYQSES